MYSEFPTSSRFIDYVEIDGPLHVQRDVARATLGQEVIGGGGGDVGLEGSQIEPFEFWGPGGARRAIPAKTHLLVLSISPRISVAQVLRLDGAVQCFAITIDPMNSDRLLIDPR